MSFRNTLLISFVIFHFTVIFGQRELNYSPKNVLPIEGNLEKFWSDFFDNLISDKSNDKIESLWKGIRSKISGTISGKCLKTLDSVANDWHRSEAPLRMLTATGLSPFPAGILSSTTIEFGDYDSCMKIREYSDSNPESWIGQYCVATLNIPRSKLFYPSNLNVSLPKISKWKRELLQKWYDFDNHYSVARGFCSPSNCHQKDLQTILQAAFPLLNSFDFQVQYCQTSTHKPSDSRIWIPATIFSFSLLLVIFGTIYSQCFSKKDCKFDSTIRAFDAVDNFQRIFDLNPPGSSSKSLRFDCFHGIRVILTLIVIVAHVAMNGQQIQTKIIVIAHFPDVIQEKSLSFAASFLSNPQIVTSLFMLICSILLSYNELRREALRENFIEYVLGRWARYMPTFIGSICVYLLLPLAGDGPLLHADYLRSQTDHCYDHWWRHVLLIQNLFDMRQMCLQTSWFIACEFQLRVMAFGLLFLYGRVSPRAAIIGAIALTLLGLIIRIGIMMQLNIIPLMFVHLFPEYPIYVEYLRWIYFSVIQYLDVYCIGFLIGQFLVEKRKFEFTYRKNALFVALGLLSLASIAIRTERQIGSNKLVDENASILTFIPVNLSFLGYSIFLGYSVFYLFLHPSNCVNRFLSHRFHLPFSKLSFSVYLIHMATITFVNCQTRSVISFDNTNLLIHHMLSVITQSYMMALVVHVIFEAPWSRVLRMLVRTTSDAIEREAFELKSERTAGAV